SLLILLLRSSPNVKRQLGSPGGFAPRLSNEDFGKTSVASSELPFKSGEVAFRSGGRITSVLSASMRAVGSMSSGTRPLCGGSDAPTSRRLVASMPSAATPMITNTPPHVRNTASQAYFADAP